MHRTAIAVVFALALLLPRAALAEPGTVEGVTVQGLLRMTNDAFMHAFGVNVGDPYDEQLVRRKFRSLWKLGLFEDITIDAEAGPDGGTVLVVRVKERAVLTSVTYEDAKAITRTEIEDHLKEQDIRLDLGKALDMGDVFFAESAIRDMLGQKGFLDAEVEAEVRKVTETTRAVHFFITSGGKTRIRKIEFVGNDLYTDRKLRSRLQLTEPRKWYWPWSQKNLYHPGKWDQDIGEVRNLYMDNGYLDIEIRPPIVDVRQSKSAKKKKADEPKNAPALDEAPLAAEGQPAPPPENLTPKQVKKQAEQQRRREEKARKAAKKAKKIKRWVHLTVPVTEGPQYRLGEVTITGNKVLEDVILRAMIPMTEGSILRNNGLQVGIDRITRLYEDRGHLYASVVRRIERRDGDERIADVEVTIDEDEPYYVARINFAGNSATHDRVLRREMLLAEGELFSRSLVEFSKAKVNQLGYWQAPEEPLIEPLEGENRVLITVAGQEQGRNEIQVGGGYSGLDGAFFNGVYSTRNFLGRGQVMSVAMQVGGRSSRYQLSFQEPWFLGRPYRLGFSIFRRDVDFGASLRSTSTGGGVVFGKRLGRRTELNIGYNWESVDSRTVLSTAGDVDTLTSVSSNNRVSSVTPFFSYNTINNPFRPSRGKQFTLSFQVAGGPLGGDTSFLKPIAKFTGYRRLFRKGFAALHAQLGMVREWQDGSPLNSSSIEGVPRFQRFWLGGDTLGPRVFETRTITPLRYVILDEEGRIQDVLGDPRFLSASDFVSGGGVPLVIEAGGDRFFLVQTEYVIPFNEQAELALFVDAGDALFDDQSWGFDTTRVSAGVELRFHLPIFPVPLRLIYGIPVRDLPGDRTSNFTFSIGRSF